MRFFLLMLALLPDQAFAWDWCSIAPPAEFRNDNPAVKFNVSDVAPPELTWLCEASDAPVGWLAACTANLDGYWNIYLRNDLSPAERSCVLDHEKAHLPPVLWEHPTTPYWMKDGVAYVRLGPRVRRASQIKPWYFVSGRHGAAWESTD